MFLGPVFPVELYTATRRFRYFVIRGLYALALLLALLLVYNPFDPYRGAMSIQEAARLASNFFLYFAWIQLLLVLAVGPALAAGTVAQERERRTIEYLFATDLSNAEVVLPKQAARLLYLLSLMLVGLPVLGIFRLLGGISADLLLAVFVITISTMELITVVGVAISVWSKRARDAVIKAYLVFGAVLLIPLWTARWIVGGPLHFLLAINPIWMLWNLTQAGGPAGMSIDWREVGWMVAAHVLISLCSEAIAVLCVRFVHLRAGGRPVREAGLLPRIRRPIGDRPMVWKEMFARHARLRLGVAGKLAGVILIVAYAGTLIYALVQASQRSAGMFGPSRPVEAYFFHSFLILLTMACVTLLMIGTRAAGSVTGEKERDCWLTLISTPLTPREIVHGKIWGAIYACRWLIVAVAAGWAVAALLDPSYILALPFTFAAFAAAAFFASALGVRYSFWCSSTLRAMGATLATLLFVGGLYLMCCLPMAFAAGPGDEELAILALAPCVPALLFLPSIIYFGPPGNDTPVAITSYGIGVVGYFIAAFLVSGSAVESFDRLCGRTIGRRRNWDPPQDFGIDHPPADNPRNETTDAPSFQPRQDEGES